MPRTKTALDKAIDFVDSEISRFGCEKDRTICKVLRAAKRDKERLDWFFKSYCIGYFTRKDVDAAIKEEEK